MKNYKLLILSVLFLLTACSAKETYIGPKKEAVAYETKILKLEHPGQLEIICDYSNLEVYTWDKKELKFELTKKLRGMYEEETLKRKAEDFKVDIYEKNNDVFLKTSYKGDIKNAADRSLDLKLYIPKRLKGMSMKIDTGTIKVLDDIRSDISIETKAVNTEINSMNGKLSFKSDLGNLKVSGGKLKKGSGVFSNMGNISIKADIEKDTDYSIETNLGNVEVLLPEKLEATAQTIGNTEINEFSGGNNNTKLTLKSGMGKISVRKFMR